jgi:hypothetical protein
MDDSSSSTAAGGESFGSVEDDVDLGAPELEELLADATVVDKAKATEDVSMATDSEDDADEDGSWSW